MDTPTPGQEKLITFLFEDTFPKGRPNLSLRDAVNEDLTTQEYKLLCIYPTIIAGTELINVTLRCTKALANRGKFDFTLKF